MTLEIRHLQALVAVADTGSITRAAESLKIGQPHLSRILKYIEQFLGVSLLERTGSGTRLTPTGSDLVVRARIALRAFDDAISTPKEKRVLTVGYTWSILGKLTVEVFRKWESEGVSNIELYLKRFDDKAGGVSSGMADMAIARTAVPEVRYKILLFVERRIAAVSMNHHFYGRDCLQLSDFSRETIVINSVSGSTKMDLWGKRGIPMNPPLLVDSVEEWNHLISLNKGIGLTPESTLAVHPYQGVKYIHVVDAPPSPVWLIWENASMIAVANRFAEIVRDIASKDGYDSNFQPKNNSKTTRPA